MSFISFYAYNGVCVQDWQLFYDSSSRKPLLLSIITGFVCFSSLAVTPGLVEPHLEGKSLSTALSGNRMFIIDLRYLEGIECTGLREVTH